MIQQTHNEQLKRFRAVAKKHGLILRRAHVHGHAPHYELVCREREHWCSADTLKELEARFQKRVSQ